MQSDTVTDALLPERLKAIRAKLAGHDGRFLAMERRLASLDGHVSALVQRAVAGGCAPAPPGGVSESGRFI